MEVNGTRFFSKHFCSAHHEILAHCKGQLVFSNSVKKYKMDYCLKPNNPFLVPFIEPFLLRVQPLFIFPYLSCSMCFYCFIGLSPPQSSVPPVCGLQPHLLVIPRSFSCVLCPFIPLGLVCFLLGIVCSVFCLF